MLIFITALLVLQGQVFDCLAANHPILVSGIKDIEGEAIAKLSEQLLIALTDYLNGCESQPFIFAE